MSDDEGSPLAQRARRKDVPGGTSTNWVMFAGGAIAMAVSVAFGRKKGSQEGTTDCAPPPPAPEEGDESFRLQSSSSSSSTTVGLPPLLSRECDHHLLESSSPGGSSMKSSSKCPAPPAPVVDCESSSSPPASKCCKQSSVTTIEEDTTTTAHISSAGRRRDRMRQQIKSRDVMIYEMQAQLLDQDQMITMHRNHAADLRECVQAITTKLFEANLEIQRLQRELMAHRAKPSMVDLDADFINYAVSEFSRHWTVHPKGVGEIILEAKKLKEEVERLRDENSVVHAKSRQCELMAKRMSALTTELQDAKAAAQGKERLLELKEQEYLKLANVVQDLQRKLEIEGQRMATHGFVCGIRQGREAGQGVASLMYKNGTFMPSILFFQQHTIKLSIVQLIHEVEKKKFEGAVWKCTRINEDIVLKKFRYEDQYKKFFLTKDMETLFSFS